MTLDKVVEKLQLKMASPSPDPYNNEFEEGYDRGIYDAIETLTQHHQDLMSEVVEKLEGMKKKEYQFEHTYPCEIGVDMGHGYEKRIEAGQKQMMTHRLNDEEVLHNQALTKAQTIIKSK